MTLAEAKGDLASRSLLVHSWDRPPGDQIELKLGRHPALDSGALHLAVALDGVAAPSAREAYAS